MSLVISPQDLLIFKKNYARYCTKKINAELVTIIHKLIVGVRLRYHVITAIV